MEGIKGYREDDEMGQSSKEPERTGIRNPPGSGGGRVKTQGRKKKEGKNKNQSRTESKPSRKGLKGESRVEYKQGKAHRSGF